MSIRPNVPLRPYNIHYILPTITKGVKYYTFTIIRAHILRIYTNEYMIALLESIAAAFAE